MNKINHLMLFLMGIMMLGWTSCSDSVDYIAPGAVEGLGAYFPATVKTAYKLDGSEGTITLEAMRTAVGGTVDAQLNATFNEGGEQVFTVPSTVHFEDGENTSSVTINYEGLKRGTNYEIALSFDEGTPYSNSDITLAIVWPEEVVYEWEVVSDEAIYTENLFAMYGATNIVMTKLEVEKAKGYDLYRFKSPYTNEYFEYVFGMDVFPDDYTDFPYIMLDGETFKEYKKWYVPSTNLRFRMVDGEGPAFDTEWNTFGSFAGNLSTSEGPIPPTSTDYPLGTFNSMKQLFDFGAIYHRLDGVGYYTTGTFTLALNPALLEPDYDRDYTWEPLPEATGYFTTTSKELEEKNWMQAVEQSNEDATFYRMPNLYSAADKAHIYFHLKEEDGVTTVEIPRGQNTGMVTYGNIVYLEGTPNKSSFDPVTGTLVLGFTFYMADESGKKVAELEKVTETFLWGQSELDQLQKNVAIDKYVGNWIANCTDGKEEVQVLARITKYNDNTLLVNGLSGARDYDDTMALTYDQENGYLYFNMQQCGDIQGFSSMIAPFDTQSGSLDDERLIGGLTKDGKLKFLNDESNEGIYDAMIYVVLVGDQPSPLTGYWNNLIWTPYKNEASSFVTELDKVKVSLDFKAISRDVTPRRHYTKDLKINPTKFKMDLNVTLDKSNASFNDFSLVK